MRYLKLFEGFAEDYNNEVKALSDKYLLDKENLLEKYKEEVDQFMFDLTDEYSNYSRSSFIEEDDHLSIFYFLKCRWSDFGKIMNILKEVDERLKTALQLELTIRTTITGPQIRNIVLNYGSYIVIEELFDYYNTYFKDGSRSKEEEQKMKEIHQYFEFNINVLPSGLPRQQ